LDIAPDELGIELETAIRPGSHATADPTRLRQAVGNLLDNALIHTPAGGQVTADVSVADRSAMITVTDTGPGFPAEFVDSAFEPFSRSDAARSRAEGGAGLGLAIVRAIAEAHGGSALARNPSEGGAEVRLTIPLSQDE
jgi:signal transduction histidine kinase